ncbi:hypothetical protein AX768_25095 [Burkholderia sp. PAMC 28687]|uniref:DUF4148 domain-containing protein n=1 Tax=Burkholderia sp. PAMC 28687 TaxID=1795874 RepID=UPI000783F140|nr:DUF4148 domain-containing protein [Burkholderia sp. PAMC 28687]AMM17481.1 hypothetical protein AX768_25095 [Burkholderia sp. PAMC 28687]
MSRVRIALITLLASLGIIVGATPDSFAQSADAASAAQPMSKQAQKAQRKADRKAVRAKNSAELGELEKNGYNPGSDHNEYPEDLQKAQSKVNAEHGQTGQ